MKAGLIVTGIWSAILLFCGMAIAGADFLRPSIYRGYHLLTLPFIIAAGLLVALSIMSLFTKRSRTAVFWVVITLHGMLFLPYNYAMSRWPGGDDGPGMAWLFAIGGGSRIAIVLSLVFAVIGIVITVRRKRKNGLAG